MTHPAGWYPDPSTPNTQRYWDGQQWSQHTQPAPPAVPAKKRRNPIKTLLTIAGVFLLVVLVISFFIPASDDDSSTATTAAPERTDPDWNNRETYTELSERDFQLLIKDPDAAAGQKHVIYGEVTQLDAATGNRSMRIDAMATPPAGTYVSGDNAVVSVDDPTILQFIVSGDRIKIFAAVKGALSYDTQIGGRTTVPEFTAVIVEVLPS